MKTFSRFSIFALLAVLTISGCKKSHDDDHLDIGGFQIRLDNQIVASQSGTAVTGSISVTPGVTTGAFSVTFVDPEGRALIIDDADIRLVVESTNASVFTATVSGYQFNIVSQAAGTANLRVSLMHGSHKDFESRPVPVTVASASRLVP
jgi:hypothetical protein